MSRLNELLQELGISKVRLAKYLGVSRQMVYNYLEMDSINKWPKEKKILFFKLLNIENGDDSTIKAIKVNADYLMEVELRLNQGVKDLSDLDNYFDFNGLKKEEQELIANITYLLKEKLLDEKKGKENYQAFTYLYHLLQSYENVSEIKYIFAYMSKATGFTNPNAFTFNEDKQFAFEGILYSALVLYNGGGTSKTKIIDSHRRFVQEIEQRNEEKLSRTAQLTSIYTQALKELNYKALTTENSKEVLEKIAEIESRKA